MKLRHFLILSLSLLVSLCFWPSWAAAEKSRPVIESLSPEGGPVGVLVTIGGSHFGNRGQVVFGARKGKIVSWTDERIEVTAPKGKGSVKLRVKSRRYGTSKPRVFAYAKPVSGLLNVKVFANNDLGMHCVDESFKVFSILPPYNVVNAQVVAQGSDGKPKLLGDGQVELRYSPIADVTGSINSTSLGKSDFWDHVAQAYGMQRAPGQGLKGLYMPADAPADAPPVFSWNPALNLFSAEGIPILPVDDAGRKNRYPLMRVTAYDSASGTALGFVDAVLPVSEETTCSTCHAKGAPAAADPAIDWADDPGDPENATRLNILKLHDAKKGTDLEHHQPVLCASCHYSPALDLAGTGPSELQMQFPTLSAALHANHADKMQSAKDQANLPGQPVVKAEEQACYECHPGRSTECLRGAMTATVTCQNCHGNMAAVGATHPLTAGGDANGLRRPWVDEPRCESCHTGDANQHEAGQLSSDGLRRYLAYDPTDPAATPRTATNRRFAEEAGKLFRHSKGHSGLACESCHGSTHAIWPTDDTKNPNDNIAAKQVQGHAGTISDCVTCHRRESLPLTLAGPHGMHNVNDPRWVNGHEDFAEDNLAACSACHGLDFRGTVLSVAAADRTFATEDGVRTLKKGQVVGCYSCHEGPHDDD